MTGPLKTPDWDEIGQKLAIDCPSKTYRHATARLLATVAQLGPLAKPEFEFRRVYGFLHYNEPARLIQVAEELLRGHQQRINHSLTVKNNAWKYVVSAFDAWIGRARIFYLAAGIVEGSLRSRLDERLTETFGEYWHEIPEVVPSNVLEQLRREDSVQKLNDARRRLEAVDDPPSNLDDAAHIIRQLREIVLPSDHKTSPSAGGASVTRMTGAEFVSQLSFSGLRSFFQAKKLWGNQVKLQSIFIPGPTETAVLRNDVDKVLSAIHEMRNEVAHYRPSGRLSFSEALFSVARLARWLDVELQWVYGSIDTRLSTELSHLLESHYPSAFRLARTKSSVCIGGKCSVGDPLDLLLTEAPTRWPSGGITEGLGLACLYHRVQTRATLHHTQWP